MDVCPAAPGAAGARSVPARLDDDRAKAELQGVRAPLLDAVEPQGDRVWRLGAAVPPAGRRVAEVARPSVEAPAAPRVRAALALWVVPAALRALAASALWAAVPAAPRARVEPGGWEAALGLPLAAAPEQPPAALDLPAWARPA